MPESAPETPPETLPGSRSATRPGGAPAVGAEARATRPRGSRAGLLLVLVLLAGVAWELAGRLAAAGSVTPLRFLSAAWTVAGGGADDSRRPSPDDLQLSPYRALPYLVYGFKPGHRWGESRGLVKTTNSRGFRGPDEVSVPKPAGVYRVVCLGGSTTFSDQVSDEDAYPRRLQEELRAARPDLAIEVVNAGVPSYTSAESLANMVFRCLELQPDAFVLYEGINDWRPRVYRDFDNAYFHYRKPWDGTLAGWEPGTGENAGGINPFIQHNPPADNGSEAENAARAGTWAFRRNLQAMCAVARDAGARVVLVSNAISDRAAPDLRTGIGEHNAVVRETAAREGALFVDLAAELATGGEPGREGLFADGVHLNPEGCREKARLIAAAMLAGGLP